MRWQFIFVVLLSLLVFSCEADLTDIGSTIQPADDAILIEVDSFSVSSAIDSVPYIYSKPDSFLLGSFVDNTYGTFNADILTQLQPPLDVTFPKNATADSVNLYLAYSSWFGDQYSPLEISVYKMDKGETFSEMGLYKSNEILSKYTTKSVKLGSKIITASDYAAARANKNVITVNLSDAFKTEFKPLFDKFYTKDKEDEFQKDFNGLYITTNFGTASILNISYIYMRYFYHYPVTRKGVNGADTTVMFSTHHDYPASDEVRSVNRFELPQKKQVYDNFKQTPAVNVISSPANIYTNVTIPFQAIKNKLNSKVGNKTLLLNRAKFRINITDVEDTTLAIPLVSSVMMMYESEVDTYFKKRQLPTDTVSVIANVSYEYDANKNVVYYYSFDLAKILTHELAKKNNAPAELKFRLIPVSITYDGSKNIKEIKQQSLMRAVKLCSATHPDRPMRLDMVYSGF